MGIFALKQEFVCFYIEFCVLFCGRWQEQVLGVLWGELQCGVPLVGIAVFPFGFVVWDWC